MARRISWRSLGHLLLTAVRLLKAAGRSVHLIERFFAKYPNGVAGRYKSEGRLRGEIARAFNKPDREPPEQPRAGKPKKPTPDGLPVVTDDALALAFTERHPALRYVEMWGRWLRYDGTRWAIDERCTPSVTHA